MWTLLRFSLSGGGARAYRDALELLRRAGFRRAGAERIDPDAAFPAAVVGDVGTEPEEATRAVFAVLREAGLRPVAVSGARVALRPAPALGARA